MSLLTFCNALICALISLRLIFYRRSGARHRPWASRLAYALILASGYVPIEALLGSPPAVGWSSLAINLVLCIAVWSTRGNVCDLFRTPAGGLSG